MLKKVILNHRNLSRLFVPVIHITFSDYEPIFPNAQRTTYFKYVRIREWRFAFHFADKIRRTYANNYREVISRPKAKLINKERNSFYNFLAAHYLITFYPCLY